jgi:alpha-tubulin suppressor-like RCC1 family protein
VLDLDDAVQIVAGVGFDRFGFGYWGWSCARRSDGSVSCWGDNRFGEFGDGTTTSQPRPVSAAGLGAVADVGVGMFDRGCGVGMDHQVFCWGAIDSTSEMPNPPTVVAPADVTGGWAADVDLGFTSACALDPAGSVYCWGNNAYGQVGLPPSTAPSQPDPILVGGIDGAVSVAVASESACALLSSGSVLCWGRGDSLGAGPGTMDPHPDPIAVAGISDASAIDALGGSCAIHGADRRVSCWTDAPEEVSGVSGVVDLAVGASHRCAALTDGSVVCWGSNSHGELGDGTTDDHAAPTPVSGLP